LLKSCLHLPGIGTVNAKVGKENNHVNDCG
jgi:hypothetical protein